jgi:hypothetical protein
MLEFTGDAHCKHISDYLYYYSGINSNLPINKCYARHETMDDYKARIKTPMK